MANVKLGEKAVGSVVTLNVNGTAKNFIVAQQGKPSSLYDDSCDGTWLLMQDIYEIRQWHSANVNNYKASAIHSYLNGTFLNLFDDNIKEAIVQAKIPYVNGEGGSAVVNGANGLSTKIFLLGGYEVGFNTNVNNYFPIDGAKLSYFESGKGTSASNKRIAKRNGGAGDWWLRSPYTGSANYAWHVDSVGGGNDGGSCTGSCGIRPALILPSQLSCSDDGAVLTNAEPAVTSDTAAGSDLGTKSEAFAFTYTVSDEDGETLTVTEKVDGPAMRTVSEVASGTKMTFAAANAAAEFQKLLNGEHTLTVEADDGTDTTTYSVTFTKSVTACSITLKTPLAVEGSISVATLAVTGSIPADAAYKVEATNNANDTEPVWQDCTSEVKKGENIVFTNGEAANGAAFNFRITASEGASGEGGYIQSVTGAFQ